MSLLSHLSPVLTHLKTVGMLFSDKIFHATNSQKVRFLGGVLRVVNGYFFVFSL